MELCFVLKESWMKDPWSQHSPAPIVSSPSPTSPCSSLSECLICWRSWPAQTPAVHRTRIPASDANIWRLFTDSRAQRWKKFWQSCELENIQFHFFSCNSTNFYAKIWCTVQFEFRFIIGSISIHPGKNRINLQLNMIYDFQCIKAAKIMIFGSV